MDRQEILERAQREGRNGSDEGMTRAEDRGRKIALSAVVLLYIVVLIINFIYDKTEYNCIPGAFFCATIAAETYARFCFTRKKSTLIWTALAIVAVVLSLIQYVGMVRP